MEDMPIVEPGSKLSTWRCGCGTVNDAERETCRACQAVQPTNSASMEERRLLRHMVGAVQHVRQSSWGYRNHFAAGPDGHDREVLDRLLARGLVRQGATRRRGMFPDTTFFYVTEAGLDAIALTPQQKKRALER